MRRFGAGPPLFTIEIANQEELDRLLRADAFSAAMSFLRGRFTVRGDLEAAIRFQRSQSRSPLRRWLYTALATVSPGRIESWLQSRKRAARNIRYHYDRPDEFYRQFLDSRMVYSCAYFEDPNWDLDRAQEAKLDLVCRKLDMAPGERFLDIGCGWGGLVEHAARRFGVRATGCTLSPRQSRYAATAAAAHGLADKVEIKEADYRDLKGKFHRIASVGMVEHVGRRRLGQYFRSVYSLLEDAGLFLNHGIARPEGEGNGPETLFQQRRVFPGGELPRVSQVLAQAELSGFEILDVENLRPHYALTCRAWAANLARHAAECRRLVDEETYRTWWLYLSSCALAFTEGRIGVFQVLMAKRGKAARRHLTRDYMYA